MSAPSTIDAGRLGIMLNELRLPSMVGSIALTSVLLVAVPAVGRSYFEMEKGRGGGDAENHA